MGEKTPTTDSKDDEEALVSSVSYEGGTISRIDGAFVIRHPNIDKPRTLDSLDMAKAMLKTINSSHGKSMREALRGTIMEKSRKMPIGTISHGRKKVAEGDWREVKKEGSERKTYTALVRRRIEGTTGKGPKNFYDEEMPIAEAERHMGLPDEPDRPKTDSTSKTAGLEGIKNSLGIQGKIKWSSITKRQATKAMGESRGMSKQLWDKLRSIESGGMSDRKKKKKLRKSAVCLVILKKGYRADPNILYSPSDFI